MLEERHSEVLRALVEEHIATAEPVSSRVVVERTALTVSAATIRHDFAHLEKAGYVVQPHTSAGRVPTAKAYRYYVDHLAPMRLGEETKSRISGFFGTVHVELTKLLKETTQLLTDVTNLPAVVVGPALAGEKAVSVNLVPVTDTQVLALVVTEGGRVMQARAELASSLEEEQLSELQQKVARKVVGAELATQIDDGELAKESDPEAVVLDAIDAAARDTSDVFVGGTRQMAALWQNIDAIERVLGLLEREATIMDLVGRAPGTSIRIGTELPLSDVDIAVVSAGFDGGSSSGSIGVIGPMRMDYRSAISAVEEVSRELEDRIGG